METDSTRALPSEVKILNKPNKPAFQGGLRLQLVKFKTGKQPWCLKPMVQHCWLPLELQRCHCAPKSPAANRGVVLLYWEQASKAQEPLYRIMQELKANTFSSLMMPPFFFLTICTTNRSDWAWVCVRTYETVTVHAHPRHVEPQVK